MVKSPTRGTLGNPGPTPVPVVVPQGSVGRHPATVGILALQLSIEGLDVAAIRGVIVQAACAPFSD